MSLTYTDAGVDITAGNAFIDCIKPIAQKTTRPEVLAGLGGFGGLFELPWHRYRQPVLVSSTDGVGTKLKLAQMLQKHDTIGIDLVAMCVNDIIVQGAEPLFFLDYFATSRLKLTMATDIMRGIGAGCKQAGVALIGGETAEMPGIYNSDDYDLAGFTVGIVEKDRLIDGKKVKPGDKIVGIASSGVHSNGFSLIRKILELKQINLNDSFHQNTLGNTLLCPTKIYVKPVLDLLKKIEAHAIAHITGGGLIENIPRVLPSFTQANLDKTAWPMPPIFHWIQEKGGIDDKEMYRTFNCGIGMVICLAEKDVLSSLDILHAAGETAIVIGEIETSDQQTPKVII